MRADATLGTFSFDLNDSVLLDVLIDSVTLSESGSAGFELNSSSMSISSHAISSSNFNG